MASRTGESLDHDSHVKARRLHLFFLEAVADDRSESAVPPPEWLA